MEALVSYLRITGDGPDFHCWERNFLNPAGERKVMLLSSKQRAMGNSKLAEVLGPVLNVSNAKNVGHPTGISNKSIDITEDM
jgi:hypothetical protein